MKNTRKQWVIGVVVLGVLYFVTWAFGVPAIHNDVASRVMSAWEQKLEGTVDPKPVKLRCQFGPAFAIFPGLIVSRTHWRTSSTGAESGWSLHLWYGFGVMRLWFLGAVS